MVRDENIPSTTTDPDESVIDVHHPECDWPYCTEDTPEESFCEKHDSMGLRVECRGDPKND